MSMRISLKDVELSRGGTPILAGISLDFPAGQTTVITGLSGCGKTTVLKVTAGIVPVDRGRVEWNGRPLTSYSERETREIRKKLGFVFQDSALWANKTVTQNLLLPVEFHFPEPKGGGRSSAADRVTRLARKLGYKDEMDLRPAQLSIGEQKIISFASALVTDPESLFLDEPLVGVDSEAYDAIFDRILSLKKEKKTMLIGTNDAKLISMCADTLVVMSKAMIRESGPFSSVIASKDPETRSILSKVLGEAQSYDGSILDILSGSDENFI